MYADILFTSDEFLYELRQDNDDPVIDYPKVALKTEDISHLSFGDHKMRIHTKDDSQPYDVVVPYDTYRTLRDSFMTGEKLDLTVTDLCNLQHATILEFTDDACLVAHVYVYYRKVYSVTITKDTVSELNAEGKTVLVMPTAFGPTSLLVPLSEEQQGYVRSILAGEPITQPYTPLTWEWNYEPS